MKMRPILFSGPMVRALLGDRKTMTRRAIKKPEPTLFPDWFTSASWEPDFGLVVKDHEGKGRGTWTRECPYGQPGDILWVRETFATDDGKTFWYRADGETYNHGLPWKPSIHMPRKAARIFLQVKGVRVERLHAINSLDAMAEGVESADGLRGWWYDYLESKGHTIVGVASATASFRSLWRSINGDDSWDANPWVWVVEFRRLGPGELAKMRMDELYQFAQSTPFDLEAIP